MWKQKYSMDGLMKQNTEKWEEDNISTSRAISPEKEKKWLMKNIYLRAQSNLLISSLYKKDMDIM